MDEISVSGTYAGLGEGRPTQEMDAELVLAARKAARHRFGEWPCHVILPDLMFVNSPPFHFSHLPPVRYLALLSSDELPGDDHVMSMLAVVFFGPDEPHTGILNIAARELRNLPWEDLAKGCDP